MSDLEDNRHREYVSTEEKSAAMALLEQNSAWENVRFWQLIK